MSNKRKFLSNEEILAQSQAAAQATGTGKRAPFPTPGRYVLRVGRTQAYLSRKQAVTRQIEFRVVRVLPCEARPFQHGVTVAPLQVGAETTIILTLNPAYPSYFENESKDFATAVAWNLPGITAQDIADLFNDQQAGQDALLVLNVVPNVEPTTPKDKFYTKNFYDGRVPAAEFAKDLSAADKELLFPNGELEKMIALEAEQAAAGFGPKKA